MSSSSAPIRPKTEQRAGCQPLLPGDYVVIGRHDGAGRCPGRGGSARARHVRGGGSLTLSGSVAIAQGVFVPAAAVAARDLPISLPRPALIALLALTRSARIGYRSAALRHPRSEIASRRPPHAPWAVAIGSRAAVRGFARARRFVLTEQEAHSTDDRALRALLLGVLVAGRAGDRLVRLAPGGAIVAARSARGPAGPHPGCRAIRRSRKRLARTARSRPRGRPQLEQALVDDDPEVRLRARLLVDECLADEIWSASIVYPPRRRASGVGRSWPGSPARAAIDCWQSIRTERFKMCLFESRRSDHVLAGRRRALPGQRQSFANPVTIPAAAAWSFAAVHPASCPCAYSGPLRAQITSARRMFIEEFDYSASRRRKSRTRFNSICT